MIIEARTAYRCALSSEHDPAQRDLLRRGTAAGWVALALPVDTSVGPRGSTGKASATSATRQRPVVGPRSITASGRPRAAQVNAGRGRQAPASLPPRFRRHHT